ncbi:MAG: hypothetical protein IID51_13110, partial [Proteobacteria bacterium]|nr:hypothetical protein [Pseudomonadota bacterium]
MRQFFRAALSLAFLLAASLLAAMEGARAATPDIAVEVESYRPGHPFWVALTLTPGPGGGGEEDERISWRNPGAAGAAPVFNWSLPPGFTLTGTRWPIPGAFDTGTPEGNPGMANSGMAYGYSGPVTLLFEITPPGDTTGRAIDRFSLTIAWQESAPREKISPPEVQLVIALGPGDGARATARRELFAAARGAMPLPSLWPAL